MARKILILSSSPRKNGNTNTVTQWCVEGAKAAGATVKWIDVANLKYKANGCTACMKCQQSDKYECVIKDEASAILKRVHEFDTVVAATPTYFFGPNAQLKLILDRMFCLMKVNPQTGEYTFQSPNQAMALIATSGGEMDGGLGVTELTFKTMGKFTGAKYYSLLVPSAPNDPQELQANMELKQRALEFGRNLATG